MKAVYAAVIAGAAVAYAQNTTLAECGMTCINNMIAKLQASPYGCPNSATCFCCKPDFGYGVRDCSNQFCSSSSDATSAIAYAASYCASALPSDQSSVCTSYTGAGVTGSATSASGASATGSAAVSAGSAFLVPVASGLSGYSIASTTITPGGPEATLSGTAYTALSSNGGVEATASGVSTTYDLAALNSIASAASAASGASSGAAVASSVTGPSESASAGSSVTTITTTTGTTGGATGAVVTTTSTRTTSTGAAAMITAAPAMLGAAALAMLAL